MSRCWSPFWRQVFVVSGTCLNAIGNGCAASFTAILLPRITDPKSELHVSEATASWVASILAIGIITGNLTVPFTMHKFGRKPSQVLSTIPPILGWFAIAWAQNTTTLMMAKYSQGLGMGMFTILSPVYIGEMTSPKNRGMFLASISLGVALGMLLCHFMGTLFEWRTIALVCPIFQVLTLLISLCSPETPNWLVSKSRFDKSERSIRWLRGDSKTEIRELDALILAQKLKQIRKQNTLRNKTCSPIMTVVKDKAFFKPLFIMLNLCVIFNATGADVIINTYCIMILKTSIDVKDEILYYYIMLTFSLIRLLASLLAMYVAKIFNRRTCILAANALLVLSLTLISFYLYLKSLNLTSSVYNWIPISLLCLYSLALNIGIAPFTWTIAGEIFPMAYKSVGSFISGIFMAVVYFATLKSVPTMFSAIGVHGTFLAYAGIGSLCTLYIYYCLPETKGKTLQQIEEYFTGERVSEMKADEMHTMLNASENKPQ